MNRLSASPKTVASLPRHLSAWAAYLGWLEPELMADVAGMAHQLSQVFADFRQPERMGRAEPDGYAGISHRGTPERLLLSEWAMADAHPDEFLRRAAMGEQLFLETRRVQAKAPQWINLLYDAGPLQWGAPRLVQLAMLVILSRWAAQRGAQLRFACLQEPLAQWQEGLEKNSVRNWLASRQMSGVDEAHLQAWQALLTKDEAEAGGTETWLIGSGQLGQQLAHLGWSAAMVSCSEPLDPARVGLEVRMAHRGRTQTRDLSLPPDAVQIRLLRNPLRPERELNVPLPQRGDGKACKLYFSSSGRQLLVQQDGVALYVVQVPVGPQNKAKVRKFDQWQRPILGAHAPSNKQCLMLQAGSDGLLYFHQSGAWMKSSKHCRIVQQAADAVADAIPVLLLGHWHPCASSSAAIWVVDACQCLWQFNRDSMDAPPKLIAKNVVHFQFHANIVWFAFTSHAEEIGLYWHQLVAPYGCSRSFAPPLVAALKQDSAIVETRVFQDEMTVKAMAQKHEHGNWTLTTATTSIQIPDIIASARMVGVVERGKLSSFGAVIGDIGPLLLEDGLLRLHQHNSAVVVRDFGGPVQSFDYHAASGTIAWVDGGGWLHVGPLQGDQEWLHTRIGINMGGRS